MSVTENIDLPAVIGTCIPVLAILVGCVSILAFNWRKAKATECRTVLIQTMLEKGFSPEEIEKVIKANDLGLDECESACRSKRTKV